MNDIMPVGDKDSQPTVINTFREWEEAFRVYSGIYTQEHPDQANEIFQYIDTISSGAADFTWDNVHTYDKMFRHLMEDFPERTWCVMYHHG